MPDQIKYVVVPERMSVPMIDAVLNAPYYTAESEWAAALKHRGPEAESMVAVPRELLERLYEKLGWDELHALLTPSQGDK